MERDSFLWVVNDFLISLFDLHVGIRVLKGREGVGGNNSGAFGEGARTFENRTASGTATSCTLDKVLPMGSDHVFF